MTSDKEKIGKAITEDVQKMWTQIRSDISNGLNSVGEKIACILGFHDVTSNPFDPNHNIFCKRCGKQLGTLHIYVK